MKEYLDLRSLILKNTNEILKHHPRKNMPVTERYLKISRTCSYLCVDHKIKQLIEAENRMVITKG
jgi:hypothetical protein